MIDPTKSRQVGRFSFDATTSEWNWDDEIFRMHGYEPGAVEPTSELMAVRAHDDDRDRVNEVLGDATRTGDTFSVYYRIVSEDGEVRRVVAVGEGSMEEDGRVIGTRGHYIDLTPDFEEDCTAATNAAVAAAAGGRAAIEQAKGALMLVYGLDADAAFAMLRWWSRNRNVKIRDIAERLLGQVTEGTFTDAGLRKTLDTLLDDLTREMN